MNADELSRLVDLAEPLGMSPSEWLAICAFGEQQSATIEHGRTTTQSTSEEDH